ncbi:ATP-dependent DNA ligase [Hoyosella subflava]|uniref:DNA ligase (ATP) n=1 Tax=Hoyosella subflava (strain DSM 45089 / JCM 17490 / NBRC 109087 / DQS3-9A1) TaxID=443218 RepID=F6EK69_HOYSD|nr:ATP-dependent DNA ligase [Hoyosella subflava]AEF42610.1 DNA ligase [Hoyosella subflava DQS3-9A1]
MQLPVMPPLAPMLAKAAATVPEQAPDASAEPTWLYEPKWDGFRAIVFRDGDDVVIGSRGGKDLSRYFPEVVTAVRDELPGRCVVDGEIVVPQSTEEGTRLDWEALSARIHPAERRVRQLSVDTPALFVGFDLLAHHDRSLLDAPFGERRGMLTELAAAEIGPARCHVTRATNDAAVAQHWFETFEGAGLDGVIAKRLASRYLPNKRELVKVKHSRTAEAVVIGYRPHKSQPGVGSVLLGLYDGDELKMVGGMSAFTNAKRIKIQEDLDGIRSGDRAEGEVSRWRTSADAGFVPVRPERVAEVAYDQMEGDRFRHAVRLLRWRPDRDPRSCTYDQLEVPVRYDLADVLEGSAR